MRGAALNSAWRLCKDLLFQELGYQPSVNADPVATGNAAAVSFKIGPTTFGYARLPMHVFTNERSFRFKWNLVLAVEPANVLGHSMTLQVLTH